jgi:NADH dehydrogenase
MDISSVCILGGSGFVGRSVAEQASNRGLRVRVVTRSEPRARDLLVLPMVETMVADPNDEKALARSLDNMDAVVNLVGILHPSGRATFASEHVELPRKIVRACRVAGVRQFVQMSALGASASAPSEYLRSKAAGEEAVRAGGAELPFTIFRPSVIFGEHDRFLNLFATMARMFPAIPLGGAHAKFQPVWVEDVARAIVSSLGEPRALGSTFELCGPRVYSLEELVRFAAGAVGRSPRIIALPAGLASLQAFVFEHLPGQLLTRDNLRSMSVANVGAGPFPQLFGFEPSPLEAIAPEYLGRAGSGTRARYPRFRHLAGR